LKQELKNIKLRLEKVEKERAASRHELVQHVEKIKALRMRLEEVAEAAKSIRTPLRYKHFLDGGSIAKYADAFFNLPNMEVVAAFLDTISIRNDNDKNDLGICSRLRSFRSVDVNMRGKGSGLTNTKGRHRSVSRVLLLLPVGVKSNHQIDLSNQINNQANRRMAKEHGAEY
jgi:hypothetical protein